MLILSTPVCVGNSDTGINPGFVDIQSTAILTKNLKCHSIPPSVGWKGSAVTGHPAKSSRFERDKFTGYLFAPFIDALTENRTI